MGWGGVGRGGVGWGGVGRGGAGGRVTVRPLLNLLGKKVKFYRSSGHFYRTSSKKGRDR